MSRYSLGGIVLFSCIAYIQFLAFFSDLGVAPFLSKPPLFFWLFLLSIFFLRVLQTGQVINIATPIPFALVVYSTVICITVAFHIVNETGLNLGFLATYLSFFVYIFLFFTIFYGKLDTLRLLAIGYIYLVIVSQTLALILEFHLIVGDVISRADLWNNSVEHYATYTKRNLDFFWYRPLGIYGQPTYNGVIPILAFFALLYFKRVVNQNDSIIKIYKDNSIMLVMVILSVIYSGSVTAYLLLFFMLLATLFFYNLKAFFISSFVFTVLLGTLVLLNNQFIEYIGSAYNTNQLATADYYNTIIQADFLSLLFGFGGGVREIISPDTNLYFLVSVTGLIGLLAYITFYVGVFVLIKNIELRIFFVALFFGSLHYVVLGNQVVHILVALLIAHYLLNRRNVNSVSLT